MNSIFTWFVSAASGAAAPFLLDTFVKATVLLTTGYLAATFLCRASAAVRHRVWCLTFISLLILPVLPLVLPDWRLPILPVLADSHASSLMAPALENPPASPNLQKADDATMVATRPDALKKYDAGSTSGADFALKREYAIAPTISGAAENPSPAGNADSFLQGHASGTIFWRAAIVLIWLTGFVAALLPIAASLIHNRILGKNARPVADAEVDRLMAELRRSLSIKHTVRLLETEKSLVPMAWGLWRATVLVPRAWREWPLKRQRIVLLHELAHVKRWDMGFQLLARLACALYWFHPLAWHAMRRLRIERESACDDCVLMAGECSSDYAEQLLAIARDYSTVALSTAVAMAQSTKLERRIRALLDQAHSHLSVSRSAGRLVFILSAILLTGVALIGPANTAEPGAQATSGLLQTSAAEKDSIAPTSTDAAKTANNDSKTDETRLEYRGQVVDPDGKPVAGAKIYLTYWLPGAKLDYAAKSWATTDKEGQFEFITTKADFEGNIDNSAWLWSEIVAKANGYGFAADNSVIFETTGKVVRQMLPETINYFGERLKNPNRVLRLVRDDTPINGRILNNENKPVAGTRIQAKEVWINEKGDLTPFEEAAKDKKADFYSLRRHFTELLNGPQLPFIVPDATTDQEGRFTLRGVGCERVVELMLSGPGIETKMIYARTRKGDTIVVPDEWRRANVLLDGKDTFYVSDFDYAAGPSNPILGRVTDADTGKPIPGVLISAGQEGMSFRSGAPWIATTTDADGRYRLDGMPVGKENDLNVFPPESTAYLPAGLRIDTRTAQPSLTRDFQLKQGVWVRGRAIDDRTGKPVPGRVQYSPFEVNPHLKSFPMYGKSHIEHERRTDEDGRFEIAVMPGLGLLTFKAVDHARYRRGVGVETITGPSQSIPVILGKPMKNFETVPININQGIDHVLRQINPKEGSKPIELTLMLTSGINVPGYVLDPEGKRLSGVIANGNIQQAWYPIEGEQFYVEGYYPDRPRDLFFYDPDRDLAGYYRLEGKPPKELAITLQPAGSLSGRLVDDKGAPMAGVKLEGEGVPGENYGNTSLRLDTDKDGRFLIRGLVPGRKYTILAQREMILGVLPEQTADRGKKDIGDIRVESLPQSPEDKPAKNKTPGNEREESYGPSDPSPTAMGNPKGEINKPIAGRNFVIVPFATELQRAANWRYGNAKLYILINGKALLNDENTTLNTAALDFEGLSNALTPYFYYDERSRTNIWTRTDLEVDNPSSSSRSESPSVRSVRASEALLILLNQRFQYYATYADTKKNIELIVKSCYRNDWDSLVADLCKPATEDEIRLESGIGDDLVKAYPICTSLSRDFYLYGSQARNCVIRNMKPLDQLTPEEIQAFPKRAKDYVAQLALKQSPKVHFLANSGQSLSKANRAESQFNSFWDAQGFDVSNTRTRWEMGSSWTPPVLRIKVSDDKGVTVPNVQIKAEYLEENKEFLRISGALDAKGDWVDMYKPTFTRENNGRWRCSNLMPSEDFIVTVKSPGYKPVSQTLNVPEGAPKELEVTLKREIP